MLFSALFIQQSLGKIEIHFHVFAGLALLLRYRDMKPLLAGVVTAAVHHLAFNYCQQWGWAVGDAPITIFDYGAGLDIVLLHAAFVVFEAALLGYMIVGLTEQLVENANKAADDRDVLSALNKAVIEQDTLTRLPENNQYAEVVNGLLSMMDKNFRVRQAFDKASTSLVLTDAEGAILDMNVSASGMFERQEKAFRSLSSSFSHSNASGSNIEAILPGNVNWQSAQASSHYFDLADRHFSLWVTPVENEAGKVVAYVIEWKDRTADVLIESEVEQIVTAAARGNLTQRLSSEGKRGFHASLADSISRLVSSAERDRRCLWCALRSF